MYIILNYMNWYMLVVLIYSLLAIPYSLFAIPTRPGQAEQPANQMQHQCRQRRRLPSEPCRAAVHRTRRCSCPDACAVPGNRQQVILYINWVFA